ncbi:MAG TPA: BtrH N-terminal domain-containing protein, partial [Actinomycetes bacterium]|nr:BtrH N-terminal domain-containing protein [Actinomycetes bacterium]
MTAHKHLKERIRARMARTGESYTTARRHVLNALPPAEYQLLGGTHPDTSAIAGVLANRGLVAPHTGQPLSEAMVLGAGGGLGAGYILWEFKSHHRRSLVLGFRNSWQYPDRWALKACARLGVPAGVHETGSARRAAEELRAAVGQGAPAIVWADQQLLGYRHLPAWLEGHGGPPVTVYGLDEQAGVALVDDRNRAPLTVSLDALAAARARVGSYKHRQLVLDAPAAELDTDGLRRAVLDGLAEQVEHLGQRSDSFSLPAFRKWARLLTDPGNAKGWPKVFADRAGLFDACLSVHENIEPVGWGGGNLRELYAEFLDEAAGLLDAPALQTVAAAYREAAARWHQVAEVAVPAGREPFAEARRLTRQLQDQVERGDAAQAEAAATAAALWALRDRWRSEFPGDADALLAALAGAVTASSASAAAVTAPARAASRASASPGNWDRHRSRRAHTAA